jgi:hypothetical protein
MFAPTQPEPTITVIEEIIFVPIIHNIIKPGFINPEYDDHLISGGPSASPIKIRRIDDTEILTPEGLRKLAESIIR